MDLLVSWWRRWGDSVARDVVIGLAMTTLMLLGSYGEAHPTQPADQLVNGHTIPQPPTAVYLLVAIAGLVLVGRRRWPMQVLVASTVAVAAYSLLGYVNGAALLGPVAALYAVASVVTLRRAVWAALGTLVVLMATMAANNPLGPTGGGFILIPGLVAAALFAGIAVANRRAYVLELQSRTEDEARRRVDAERLRIARELHDVVAHTMATIHVQAGVAAHIVAERPDAALEALLTIKSVSKEGLRELRAILNVLRQVDEAEDSHPAPGLDQLDTLLAGARRAGLPTALAVVGDSRPLPPTVDLAAYRIIQESLTNVIRHAGPAEARISLTYAADAVRIAVTDTGRGSGGDGIGSGGGDGNTGYGLVGMRERAASVGGTLLAGPGARSGFRVEAELPIGDSESAAGTRTATPSAEEGSEA